MRWPWRGWETEERLRRRLGRRHDAYEGTCRAREARGRSLAPEQASPETSALLWQGSFYLASEKIGEDLAVDHVHLHPTLQILRRRAQRHVLNLLALVLEKLDQLGRRNLPPSPVLAEVPCRGQERL